VERSRHERRPLYVCFVDFRKAYDSVQREMLWAKLEARGVRGRALEALKALYANVPISVKTAAGLTAPFQTTVGLKQGDPTSPNVFGLYVDDLEDEIMGMGDAADLPCLDGLRVPPLMHADDLALCATSHPGLQRQMDKLAAYAARWGLEVSLSKTKAMVFEARQGAAQREYLTYAGQRIAQVEEFAYLGITFHETKPVGATAVAARLPGARRALAGLRRYCARTGLSNPAKQCELFDTLVRTTLSHGVEVWGPAFVGGIVDGSGGHDDSETFHRAFLRRLLGVRGCTPNFLVLAEFGRFPLACYWARLVFAFWRRVEFMGDERPLLRAAVRDSMQLAEEQAAAGVRSDRLCWGAQVKTFITRMGVDSTYHPLQVEQAARQLYLAAFRRGAGVKLMFYKDVVRGGDDSLTGYAMQPYLQQVLPRRQQVALARFRTSAHYLGVEVGRWSGQERSLRTCRLCGSGDMEDEQHMVFHCAHPDVVAVRDSFGELFSTNGGEDGHSLSSFLALNPRAVAAFVAMCFSVGDYANLPRYTS
jgi:hypothetical protein